MPGLLHDCAKCIPNDKKLHLCGKYGFTVSDIERENPSLLHAKLGACLAHEKYGVTDKEIIHAIESHTTGCPAMTMLEKIIYIAVISSRQKRTAEYGGCKTACFSEY